MKMNTGLAAFLLAALAASFTPEAVTAQQSVSAEGNAAMPEQTRELGKIRLSFDGGEAVVELYDNPASRDLASMLPLTLKFKDYNGVEKIAYPPRKLVTEGAPFGLTPSVGDFALYAPWGNMVAYYRAFSHSGDLVPLGRFTSGIPQLAKMNRDFSVQIEVVK
jgi:hypothetical protein